MIRRGKWYRHSRYKYLVRVIDTYDWVVAYKWKGCTCFADLEEFEENYEQVGIWSVIRSVIRERLKL